MTHRGCYGLIQVMAPNLVSKCLLISNAQNTSTAGFPSPAKQQGSAPFHIVTSLDYSSSDLIFTLFLWLPKETKLLKPYLWCWTPNREILTDFNWNFRMRQSSQIPTFFWRKWHLSGTEKPSQNHQGKEKGNLLLCIPIVSWLVCQQMLWATLHMWSCQVTTSANVLLHHEHLGSKMKL